mmetsp:Transcript_19665/g.58502  ORF Transcript_19665/g.58502 Transcript_19665/m.58502 type:complete len:221 (-) Transcript_19665:1134-1796(-)
MMSAVKILTPFLSAYVCASGSTGTSKPRMQENSSWPFCAMMAARRTSFLWMGPTVALDTGMGGRSLPARSLPGFRRNSSRASSAPSVEACTVTPLDSVTRVSVRDATSFMTSSRRSSRSSSAEATTTPVPGMTFVSSWSPVIFRPIAPSSVSCLTSSDLTRVSRDGGGVSSARACVTTGPSCVQRTMVSPAWSAPFTRITSSVAPRPSTTFTSSTVHCRL